ncbi:MAG: protein-glutamine gamma-glutamyltransferase [Betaproteobacteria bacterium]|nr:protein-glutamine gamma-glutamyltransferase [Betaproteobacteria bacterium]
MKSLPHPLAPELRAVSARDLVWLIGSFALVIAPHTLRAPWWLTLLTLCLYGWRLYFTLHRAPLPSRWLVLGVAAVTLLAMWIEFRTLFGRQPGILLLVVFSGLKLLETRTHRDAAVAAFLAYFLVITNFLYTQSILNAALMTLALLTTTATLVGLAAPQREVRANLRTSAVLLAQAVPAALVLFLLFPRVQGPLWGLPQDAYSGMTGLSETMSPGTLSNLAQYDAIAFRAEFEGEAPLHALRYWRGPVLWDFDGRTWSIGPDFRGQPPQAREGRASYRYSVVLEPHNRNWLFALETAASVPERARMTFDGQLLSTAPVRTRLRYELTSVIAPEPLRTEVRGGLSRAMRIPPGSNPRAQALAAQWQASSANETEIVQRAIEFLRAGRYAYTLEPPLLGLHSVDEFLFDTRAGFCEHFASAFTFLMRAAGVPSRVVTGYQGGELNPYDRIVTVRQWDAHAWSEVFIPGRGWLRVDPTAAAFPRRVDSGVARAVPENAGMPLMMQPHMEWLRSVRSRWEAVAHKWNVWVLGYNPERQRDLMQWVGIRDADWRALTAALFSILGLITAGLLLWSLRRLARPDPVQKAWRAFGRKLAARGGERAPHEGPRDYTTRAARSVPDARRTILRIGELYIGLRYGAQRSAAGIARLQRLVRTLRVT